MNGMDRRGFLMRLCLGLSGSAMPAAARADAIHDAVAQGDLALVKRLLAANPRSLEARNSDHLTPLLMAVALGKSEIARFLIARGADVNARKADGNTPIFDAAHQGDAAMTLLLIQHGANMNAQNKKGETPLHYAVIYDKPDVALALITHHAGVNISQNDGKKPLFYAVEANQPRLVPILRAHGADWGALDHDGVSPLVLALSRLGSGSNDGGAALLASIPVSLDLANTPLRDAFIQLFRQAHQEVTVSQRLAAPVTMRLATNLGEALNKLLHVDYPGMEAPTAIAVADGKVRIAVQGEDADLDHGPWPVTTVNPRFQFLQTISLPVLNNYLSRAVTHYGLCATSPEPATTTFDDDMRMLTSLGAKFVGRAAYAWVPPDDDDAHFQQAAERAAKVAAIDPEIILQACIWEAVYEAVGKTPVPSWAFHDFGLPVVNRTFNYSGMLYDGNKYVDHWAKGASVPDMSKQETKLYFYYRARRYLDAGFESLHFGQVSLMDENDPDHAHWWDLLTRVRRYAAENARRRMALCVAHTHGIIVGNGLLLFDFHSWPLMAQDVEIDPEKVELIIGYYNSIYRQSAGGISFSAWSCARMPYLCEFDCGGVSDKPGQPSKMPWNWGYSCGDWFAHQPADYRASFIRYANNWLNALQEDAHLQMPTRLNLAVPIDGVQMWQANQRSTSCPSGFSLEKEIKTVWQ